MDLNVCKLRHAVKRHKQFVIGCGAIYKINYVIIMIITSGIQERVREMRLRWHGHMLRMEENNEVRAVVDMRVPGKRPRGRPRGRWMDCVPRDMQALRITPEDAQDRTFWKSRIRAADPT